MNRIEHSTSEGLCYLSNGTDAGFDNINRSHFLFSLSALQRIQNSKPANERWIELKVHPFRTNRARLEVLRKRCFAIRNWRLESYCSLTLPLLPSLPHGSSTLYFSFFCFSFIVIKLNYIFDFFNYWSSSWFFYFFFL